jgi:hypothetical protein
MQTGKTVVRERLQETERKKNEGQRFKFAFVERERNAIFCGDAMQPS